MCQNLSIVPFKYVRLLYVNYTVKMFKYMCIDMYVCIIYSPCGIKKIIWGHPRSYLKETGSYLTEQQ